MPKTNRRNKNSRKREIKDQDDTDTDSGKLSETQEVAKRLSRTRLGKENAKKASQSRQDTPKKVIDPYDADSEVESDINLQEPMPDRMPMSPMATDSENVMNFSPPVSAIRHQKLRTLPQGAYGSHEHSTPSIAEHTPGTRLNDSLFGFGTAMESPLTFSPFREASENAVPTSVIASPTGSMFSATSSQSSISPGKRKLHLRLFDMPIEKPPPKKARRKQKQPKPEATQEVIGNVIADFQEVEMFDLLIQ